MHANDNLRNKPFKIEKMFNMGNIGLSLCLVYFSLSSFLSIKDIDKGSRKKVPPLVVRPLRPYPLKLNGHRIFFSF